MDRILALDCSNRWTCGGIVSEGIPVSEINVDLGRTQAAMLPSVVDSLLSFSGMSLQDIDAISVTVGPGYFTGIRIAMAYGLSLAKGLGLPVIPISSLEALAREATPIVGDLIVPCIRAGRDAVYSAAFYLTDDGFEEVMAEKERSLSDLSSVLNDLDGFPKVVVTEDRTCQGMQYDGSINPIPRIGGIATALTAWNRKDYAVDPEAVKARYHRDPGIGGFSR